MARQALVVGQAGAAAVAVHPRGAGTVAAARVGQCTGALVAALRSVRPRGAVLAAVARPPASELAGLACAGAVGDAPVGAGTVAVADGAVALRADVLAAEAVEARGGSKLLPRKGHQQMEHTHRQTQAQMHTA